ncbi:hypothetical protein [Zestomonas thermotolerans]|uniref:hypothetical protein n=1 Tax=Zestomonas thermotolerans TaxID=157784 RepID=UPI00036270C9|nr:hypothetical protein [Pseudomonas thermotolerans]
MADTSDTRNQSRYKVLIEKIFFDHYKDGLEEFAFARDQLPVAANALGIELPKNLGDVVYSIRYRTPMPDSILATQPEGKEWIIEGAGRSRYLFKLVPVNRIVPNANLLTIKIPDATPEIIAAYALSDEQALLAKVRYNRLIDIFLGIAAYSLQNHLRTTVSGIGQIEIDEIYVGLDRHGRQYVLPVQAKGGRDQLSVVQTKQDILCCSEKFPNLICRSISAQFMASDLIAMFELAVEDGHVKVVDEKHYRLVPSDQIGSDDLRAYNLRG